MQRSSLQRDFAAANAHDFFGLCVCLTVLFKCLTFVLLALYGVF